MFSWDFFISHSGFAEGWVRKLAADARKFGLKVFVDNDNINFGDPILQALDNAISNSRDVVLALNSRAAKSKWVALEASIFKTISSPDSKVIPVLLDETPISEFRMLLQGQKYANLADKNTTDDDYLSLLAFLVRRKFCEPRVLDIHCRQNPEEIDEGSLLTSLRERFPNSKVRIVEIIPCGSSKIILLADRKVADYLQCEKELDGVDVDSVRVLAPLDNIMLTVKPEQTSLNASSKTIRAPSIQNIIANLGSHMIDLQQKSDQFFSHFGRLFATQRASDVGGLDGLTESATVADFSKSAIDDRMRKTNDELARIVEQYLGNDAHALAIAEKIRKEGGETLRRFGDRDERLASDPNAGDLLEAIVLTDGTRPTFLIKNGKVDKLSSVLGTWGSLLDSNAAQLKDAIACVGRVDHPGVSVGYIGTGFLISDNLIVTNRHVLQAIAKWNGNVWSVSSGVSIDFGHEWDGKQTLNRRAIKAVVFAGDKEIYPSQIDHSKLDMAVLSLEPTRASVKYFQIAPTEAWKSSGANVCTIGYPGPPPSIAIPPTLIEQLFQSHYGYKRLAPGEIKVPQVSAPAWTVAHDATTLGGNSGSVIISVGEIGFAAGLHYGGKWSDPRENWGHILADVLDVVDLATHKSLREVLAANDVDVPTSKPTPGAATRPDKVEIQPVVSPNNPAPTVVPEPRPVDQQTRVRPSRAQAVTLQQMRFLGVRPGSSRVESMELEAAGDGETSANALSNRKGYDPNFISSWQIPLPQPNGDMRALRRGGSGTELKYQHFSVIMSASRRMPIITAVNIDGEQMKRFPRIDKWSYDGRLNQEDQLGNELYNSNDLDRGHMVRREDPVWGDATTAKRANVDTFHYTNSCPQMAGVNQKTWLGLEDYVLQHTREDKMRISVFTGPYFSDDDMTYRGALIPKSFWKVVAFQLDDGRNSATAYKVSQSRELEDLEFVFAAYKTYQISIQQVAEDTRIDFSDLIPFDGFSTHEFTNGGRLSERIESLSQVRV